MSNSPSDFENFLTAEANRYFNELPTGAPQKELHDVKAREIVSQSRDENRVKTSDISDPLQARPSPETIQWTNDFEDVANQLNAITGATTQHRPSYTGQANTGLADPFALKLPFQETYEQPIWHLAENFKRIDSVGQASPLQKASSEAAFYFLPQEVATHVPASGAVQTNPHKSATTSKFDVHAIRNDFPILRESIRGHQLIWLDNAATTQKPQVVIDRLAHFYAHENSNIHRAAHELAARSTDAYEDARNVVKDFLHARSVNEIVFTRGTTEAINLVSSTWGEQNLGSQDEVILSNLEHHANIVPWQLLSKRKGFKIRVIPVDEDGNLLVEEYAKLLNSNTKLVAFTHVSNALGTVTPAKRIIDLAHHAGAKVLLDGAQSVSHIAINLQDLDPDFFVFSGHKIFGPTGIGVLYGKEELLNAIPPYQGGGNMIKDVRFDHTTFHDAPNKFEAGTGNIADAVGLGAALRYVQHIGLSAICQYEHELLQYATNLLRQVPGLTLIGTAREKASVLSLTLKGLSNEEVGVALNEVGIAVRTGHHCAQPILRRLGYESSVRPSIAFYNTHQEIDILVNTIEKIVWQGRRYH
ncbi:family 2A encapsulin nanocompartment cargo protein cysteine desulfurase [Sphingobacterium chungjuense]|uniref:family 2A encapsulin nanocompartment cargo protein cysteine desulfurase n=1 Tax=Sphingobacterium chungjuense TaxID=2675553 RepID=UPI00140AA1F6|nr:family 2A encapsulin nanocompartment cargo protein cysteine desulfurase [Sphingobacterium chungjuense]